MQNMDKNTELEFLLDDALKTEPDFILSDGFADKVTAKVSRSFAWNQYLKEFLYYLAVLVGIVGVLAAMAFIWYKSSIENWITFILSNISWVVGVNVLLVFILFTDRVLLRYFFYKNSSEII